MKLDRVVIRNSGRFWMGGVLPADSQKISSFRYD